MENFKNEMNAILKDFSDNINKLSTQQQAIKQDYAGDRLEAEQVALRQNIQNLKKNANERIENAKLSALERVKNDSVKLSGKGIDMNDIAMLNPDVFSLKQSEFDALAEKHKGNPAMNIALRTYAEKKHLNYDAGMTQDEKERAIKAGAVQASGWVSLSGNRPGVFDSFSLESAMKSMSESVVL